MAEERKRIIALAEKAEPDSGDYLAVDSAEDGTHKVPASAFATVSDLDEIRSQIEVTGTASGAIATFTDGADMPAKSVVVNIEPQQSGTGTPSPENVRPISGWESVSVTDARKNLFDKSVMAKNWYITGSNTIGNGGTCLLSSVPIGTAFTVSGTYGGRNRLLASDKPYNELAVGDALTPLSNTNLPLHLTSQYRTYIYYCETSFNQAIADSIQVEVGNTATTFEPYNGQTTTVNLGRTVYGGTLDVVSGVLTAYPFYPSYNGETLDGRWICDRAVYAEGTTPPTGSQVALISGTGTTYQLTPTEVKTLLGENNVWADSGDVEVVYIRDLNIAINNLLNSNGTRSLGMMAMSAPTEATAEEPTDEQSDEPAEDDMR